MQIVGAGKGRRRARADNGYAGLGNLIGHGLDLRFGGTGRAAVRNIRAGTVRSGPSIVRGYPAVRGARRLRRRGHIGIMDVRGHLVKLGGGSAGGGPGFRGFHDGRCVLLTGGGSSGRV